MTLRDYKTKPLYAYAKTVTLVDVNGDKLANQDADEVSLQDMEVIGTRSCNGHLSLMFPIGEKKVVNKVPRYSYKIEVYCTPVDGKFQWRVLQRDHRETFGNYTKIACGVAGGEWDAFQQAMKCKNKYDGICGGTL